jgi:peptide/nickel transport system ATP-binding protein
MTGAAPLLEVDGLTVRYPGLRGAVTAVDGVRLEVGEGERVGLVGESGSGKSTVAFATSRLLRPPGEVAGGSVRFEGEDLLALDEAAMDRVRGARLGMVYQDPFTFLNPVLRVGDQVGEVLRAHSRAGRAEARERAVELLGRLGLEPAVAIARKYPHQLSGGQRQRVVIAMAAVAQPRLLIADEPTTALDVTVQAQILRLLARTVADLGSSLLLISHDLAVVRLMCERVYVMYAGRIVESGPTERLFASPRHPYTEALIRASSRALGEGGRFATIAGAPPDLRHPPAGCRFAERCPARIEECATSPNLRPVPEGGEVACWVGQRR